MKKIYSSAIKKEQPEQRLAKAILTQAISDLQTSSSHVEQYQAKKWFLNRDKNYLYSFETICDFIGRNPYQIRKSLKLI